MIDFGYNVHGACWPFPVPPTPRQPESPEGSPTIAVCLVTDSIKCDNVRVRDTFAYLYCDLVTLWLAHCHRQPADKWCQCFVPDSRPTAQFVLTVSLLQNVSTIFRGNLGNPQKIRMLDLKTFTDTWMLAKIIKTYEDKHPKWLDWCLNAYL